MQRSIARTWTFVLGVALVAGALSCDSSSDRSNGTANGLASGVDAGDSGIATEAMLDRTLDESGTATSTAKRTQELESLEAQVSQLRRLKPGTKMEQALAALVQQGDAAVDEIARQATEKPPDFLRLHSSVRVLEAVNTEKSRGLLRRMALGQINMGNPGPLGWAARALIECDRGEARLLLSSSTSDVLEVAILSLRGQTLDQELMHLLEPHLKSEDADTRWRAAGIVASEAPPGELAERALKGIGMTLAVIADMSGVDALDESTGHVNYQMTVGEAQYGRYIPMLIGIRVENSALREVADQQQGRARDAVLLALAHRGDESVREEIVDLAQDAETGLFRAWAASALETVGTTAELPLLQMLAKNDSLFRKGGGNPPPGTVDRNYPVRRAARQAITAIEKAARTKQ